MMDEERHPQLWIGTSGWVYLHWRKVFYPTKLPTAKWLSHYTSCDLTCALSSFQPFSLEEVLHPA